VLERLRMSIYTKNIPVIALTGNIDPILRKKVQDAGVSAYMEKPYDFDLLLAEVKKALGSPDATPRKSGSKKILIVDDEEDIRRTLEMRFKSKGYDVLTAADGEEALGKARTISPDIMLLDIMLPKIDGWAVCMKLKTDPKYKHIPIVLLSALIEKSTETEKGIELGDYLMAKPFEFEALLQQVERLLQSPRQA
jgi:DNA-binding response OmpR family regulator